MTLIFHGSSRKGQITKVNNSKTSQSPFILKTTSTKLVLRLLLLAFLFVLWMNILASSRQRKVSSVVAPDHQKGQPRWRRGGNDKAVDSGIVGTTKKGNSGSNDNSNNMPRVLVIYFPQYHRDPLNDRNWGENFTDFVSLQKSPEKNREGYRIPRPLENEFSNGLGYYDLENVEPRKRQGHLAKQYDIDGFIYHHYWFYDRSHPGPNLAKPLLNMLKDGHPDRPFLLNWCATKWVNVWMGKTIFQKIPTNKNRALTIQEQFFEPTVEEIREHYDWLAQFFHHPNYIKMNHGTQPVLLLYIYDERAVPILKQLREFAIEDGFTSLYLIVGRSGPPRDLYDTSHLEGDQREAFERQNQPLERFPVHTLHGYDERNKFVNITTTEKVRIKKRDEGPNSSERSIAVTYRNVTVSVDVIFNQSMTYPYPLGYVDQPFEVPKWCHSDNNNNGRTTVASIPEITGVITTFDNTPRREYKSSNIYNQGPPKEVLKKFETNLYAALYYQKCCLVSRSAVDGQEGTGNDERIGDMMEERFVAINSWNEWAEGMAIEPSDVYEYGWLETIQKVKSKVENVSC
mmetsp:Transcript_56846/g.138383  ORF Transcript_56846/g.138383 Transcript_56846/m.138383 type:complete len:571 (+) Transcript_56846:348-2060(+)|eukprot:CAMPEP_0113479060 /NCGR_PEP_ID=MMETSP0014_2-20120614/21099_1 /TAXON_ID=2857 /ORGANISM="Nitzschia sp." /LENGTH=570 /DNA_ID=CAMNT_0000372315 /DNA_START=180 /DNA_END=1892 /DNA_ORIENTATION=- /assembly_acc=CAM_ASM_000159